MRIILAWSAFLVISIAGSTLLGQEKYCGIYAVYSAGLILGVDDYEFESLISEKYVSDIQGSTGNDISAAATDMGLSSKRLDDLGVESLLSSECPMVLHVMTDGQVEAYNHWILFIGINSNGEADIVETPGQVYSMPLSSLLARWDGTAVLLDKPEKNLNSNKSLCAKGLFFLSVLVFAACVVVVLERLCRSFRIKVFFGVTEVLIPVLLVALFTLTIPGNSIRSNGTARYLQSAVAKGEFPVIEKVELEALISSQNELMLIDARHPIKFRQGALRGAKNLPYFSDSESMDLFLANIPRETKVIIYCKSHRCSYDNLLGIRIAQFGFTDIVLFEGGWEAWQDED
jgi:rhodanese-related sulfurtransferase